MICSVVECQKENHAKYPTRCWIHRAKKWAEPIAEPIVDPIAAPIVEPIAEPIVELVAELVAKVITADEKKRFRN